MPPETLTSGTDTGTWFEAKKPTTEDRLANLEYLNKVRRDEIRALEKKFAGLREWTKSQLERFEEKLVTVINDERAVYDRQATAEVRIKTLQVEYAEFTKDVQDQIQEMWDDIEG